MLFMTALARQISWSLLYAASALPVAYLISVVALSWIHGGYVRVDPVRLRRVTALLGVLVFVCAFLLKRFG